MNNLRLKKQIDFILEMDKLKKIMRRNYLSDGERLENTAEHSWHIGVLSMILSEYADSKIDTLTVMKILLIHDVVEIDAGDTYAFDEKGNENKFEREKKAAKRIFGLLPDEQGKDLFECWLEFEDGLTNEAKFAAAIDKILPVLQNYHSRGKSWKEHGIYDFQVRARIESVEKISKKLWRYINGVIDDAVAKGYLLTF